MCGVVGPLVLPGVRAASAPTETQPAYVSVAIASPTPEHTIHDNTGTVPVQVEMEPALQSDRGHRISLSLDGRSVATLQSGAFVLNDVERGTHELRAAVVDAEGHELIASSAVTFHMWQASVLFRRGKK
ncbi:MAG: hypothetical protein EHM59_13100 [Betaproteobacteria bacterium]|nr:MAG: hypothetical protein EHM59_13100 [Betaproteobacteria bacterium]